MNAVARDYSLESRITSLEWKIKGLEDSLKMERETREKLRRMDQDARWDERRSNQELLMFVFVVLSWLLILLPVIAKHR